MRRPPNGKSDSVRLRCDALQLHCDAIALRCVAIALRLRCDAIALRCVAIALRCDCVAMRYDAKLCARVTRRDSAGWCFKLAGVPGRGGPGRVTPLFQECKSKEKQ